MKWIKLIAASALVMLVFASCSKSDVQTQNRILGRWQIESNVINEYYNYQDHQTVYYGRPFDYFEFGSDGTVAISTNGYVSYLRYYLTGNNQLNIDGDLVEIRSFTNNQMILYSKKYYSSVEYDENTYYLYR